MYKLCILYILMAVCTVLACPLCESLEDKLKNSAVKKFREYLRIDTSQTDKLDKGVLFWRRQAKEYGLQFAVYEPAGKPICVLTWPGANSSLPSIMLNSHMDVVGVDVSEWHYPPYGANVDKDGNIYGRGAQDTKDIAIQCLDAIGRIKKENITLQRTIHLTLMPDEETGGFDGIKPFIKTPEFEALNIGFALDEGMTSESDDFYATYQDRRPWFVYFTVEGDGGHGFTMPTNTAVGKIKILMDAMLEYREMLQGEVKSRPVAEYGTFTSININMINGGTAPNVIPQKVTLVADMRLSPSENATEILSLVNSWAALTGNTTKVEFTRQDMVSLPTPIDHTNPYWVAMNDTISNLGYKLKPIICPATSDMLVVRNLGLPAIGFAPKRRTEQRAHGADEYLNVDVFLEGIEVYVALIKRLGNLPEN